MESFCPDSPSWQYLEPFLEHIRRIHDESPEFFVALSEAIRAEREANEVVCPPTEAYTIPSEEETVERVRRQYDLVPRRIPQLNTHVTQTYFVDRVRRSTKAGKLSRSLATQTPVPRSHSSTTQTDPLTQSTATPPVNVRPKSTCASTQTFPARLDPYPILPENFVSAPRSSHPLRSPTKIPALLKLDVPKPQNVNPRTLNFLQTTARFGCWNCLRGRTPLRTVPPHENGVLLFVWRDPLRLPTLPLLCPNFPQSCVPTKTLIVFILSFWFTPFHFLPLSPFANCSFCFFFLPFPNFFPFLSFILFFV